MTAGSTKLRNGRAGSAARPGRVLPHNLTAEDALLGAMMLSREACEVAHQLVLPEHFYRPASALIYEAALAVWSETGKAAEPVTLADWMQRHGTLDAVGGITTLIALQGNAPAISNTARYAVIVEELALLRQLIMCGGEVAELGYSIPDDVSAAVATAESMITNLAERFWAKGQALDDELSIEDLLDEAEAGYDWLWPGALEARDVLMITGASGSGKSLWVLQCGLLSAAGINPLNPTKRIPPIKTLYIQLENTRREEGRRVSRMVGMLDRLGWDRSMFVAAMPASLNLRSAEGMGWLRAKLRKHQPRLVIIAPWKDAHDGFPSAGDGGEAAFIAVKKQLDELRNRYGFALLVEAHATSGSTDSQNPHDYRPRGTIAQVNWALYGLCLMPKWEDGVLVPGRKVLGRWREPRDRGRRFPEELFEGHTWPWMPADLDDDDNDTMAGRF